MNQSMRKENFAWKATAHIVLASLTVLTVLPFVLLISASVTEERSVIANGYSLIPPAFSLAAYEYILAEWGQIGRAYGVTVLVTVIGTTVSLLITSMFAFGLLQKGVPGLKVILILLLVTMLFNGGIVPTYYVYTRILQVRNTLFGLIVPNLLMNAFTVILVMAYIRHNVPAELFEAAEMDGANLFHIFFRIVAPLSTPILATVGLLTAITYWNDWINGLYYITKPELYTIQLLLNQINQNITFLASNASKLGNVDLRSLPSATIRMAIVVVAILPILLAYPFFQKYFAKGIALGAVKG
ncbi:carbohydrate ABC transporter permease [Caldilinea sp.]|uniref:carbohydrate ABC transporter permease n=1 Tax=Caldilinea sp. TaxID=2293560 RepID=UPI0021DD4A8A|nr:carbohydrate ABC transporter permease [Caldilinea sp.]GIV68188.1 MAG: sugar ABC transporter permease [Caldilinea sp.]